MKRIYFCCRYNPGPRHGHQLCAGATAGHNPSTIWIKAFTGQAHQNKTFLSEFFGRSKNSQADQEHKSTQAKGG